MSTRQPISKKASLESTFTPPANPLKTRGFGNGIQARSAELPATNLLQTRPLGFPSRVQQEQQDTRSVEEQKLGAERFGYNAANIPVYASKTPPAVRQIVDKINTQTPHQPMQRQSEAGEYNPGSREGEELLAPEMTHLLQATGITYRKPTVNRYLQRGDYLQTQTVPTGGPNPDCLRILAEILSYLFGGLTHTIDGVTFNGRNIHRGLIERWQDLNNDPHNLYHNHRYRSQAHPQYGSWEGHQDQYRTQQRGLQNCIRDWVRNNCDDPNNSGGLPQGWRNVITNARRWLTIAPPSQPSTFVQQPPEPSFPTLIPAFVLTAAAARGISRSVLWRKFWQVVISRFAIRGAAAATLSAADGPLPVGEILSLGIAIWTVWDIYKAWDELWGQTITEA